MLLSVILGSIYDVTGTFNFDLNTWQSLIVSVPNLFAWERDMLISVPCVSLWSCRNIFLHDNNIQK